ncbi:MAG TPA: peptidase S8 [Candidatus Riflebacteria bacterium]|jgi:hypothetical protein|nr:peptidase S8 [Candidatus Riflebacteria bacterium]
MKEQLPHLRISEFETRSYTGRGAPVKSPRPLRNRAVHSGFLKKQLTAAWAAAEKDEIVYHAERHGIYLEFKGEAGFALATKSLENLRASEESRRTRLLNVRKEVVKTGGEVKETIFATVYVPKKSREAFFDRLAEYATQQTGSGSPKNAELIERIAEIRKADAVESFWLDEKLLLPKDQAEWCEVWLSSDRDEVISRFDKLLKQLKIEDKPGFIRFPERMVKVVCASHSQLAQLSELSDDIAEYRRAKVTASFWLKQSNREQAEWVKDILDRLSVVKNSDVFICILDTGINNGHPLLKPVLLDRDCLAVDDAWGSHDHHGHGTLMGGITVYGDLQDALSHRRQIELKHGLQSVKILPAKKANAPEFWGYVTAQGIYQAEIVLPEARRIICMAVTAEDSRDYGRPSSWSAEIDQLCSGAEDDLKRLIILSAGNTPVSSEMVDYPKLQRESQVHDPGQSWNALTVGAYTELVDISDPSLKAYKPLAPAGGISPFSTTSLQWENKWPIKPDVLMEGGNVGIDKSGFPTECDDLSVLSTYYKPHTAHFSSFNMTSKAAAQAAWLAAQIQARYSEYWPETIRALMVHSASWTTAMQKQFLADESKGSYDVLLKCCGYGVPDLEKALYSAGNSLTLIAQSEIQPFDKTSDGRYVTRDMHLYELPWPRDVLEALPDGVEVKMRVTLSYFVEPGPGEKGWKDRYRYASHALRFDLNSPRESKDEFVRRVNIASRDEENGHPGTASAAGYWTLGAQIRDKGSIHSDVWNGTARDLATSNLIAVYPVIGWWRERHHLQKWNRMARYSLLVSIETSEQTVDIYTPVAIRLGVAVPIKVTV